MDAQIKAARRAAEANDLARFRSLVSDFIPKADIRDQERYSVDVFRVCITRGRTDPARYLMSQLEVHSTVQTRVAIAHSVLNHTLAEDSAEIVALLLPSLLSSV